MYNYNTTQPPLLLQEYGRHIQKLIEAIKKIDDKNLRTQKANALVKLTGSINPSSGSVQKCWDNLFKLSDYQLDIDSSHSKPVKPINRPIMATYSTIEPIKYKYYGRHLTMLLRNIPTLTSPKAQEAMLVVVGKLMRRLSGIWNKEYIKNEKIIKDIQCMLAPNTPHELDLDVIRTLPDDGMNGQKPKVNYPTKSTTYTGKHKIIQ